MKRGKRINARNPKRKVKAFARAYHSAARVRWVASLACWACNDTGPIPRQNAHVRTDGMGLKSDYTNIIPLCPICHHKQEARGWLAIAMTDESKTRAAAQIQALWEERCGNSEEDDEGADFPADAESEEDADSGP